MGTFTLTIELGNDAMQTGADVARALREVADRAEWSLVGHMAIMDDNGNRVGSWFVSAEEG